MKFIFLKHGSFFFFFPCYSWALKLFMTSGGLLGFYRVGVGDCRPYAWAMVKLSSRCPSGGAVGCAQDGRPPAKEAPLEQELQQIPPVQPPKPLLSGWGGGSWKEGSGQGRAAEWECRAKSLGSKAWSEAGARVSQPSCHLSKILRQCSGLRKPRGVLCSLFFRTFPSNVFF